MTDQEKEAQVLATWADMQTKYGDKLPFVFAGIFNNAMRDHWSLTKIEEIVDHVAEKGSVMKALMEIRSLLKNRKQEVSK